MPNFKLTLAYEGTDFRGWQIQPGQPTIQGTLITTLERILQDHITLHGAGRTDAGVHALGQVANFRAESDLSPGEIQRACNALLPPTIRVLTAEEAPEDFHSRRSARAKTYRYRVYRGRIMPPFSWRHVHQDFSPMDFDVMQEAASSLIGEHDFTTFSASAESEEVDHEPGMTRTIYSSRFLKMSDISQTGAEDEWIYEVRGRSFLRYMVRKMVGTLVEVGRGRLKPDDIPELFEQKDRSKSGPTMPPQGLCLMNVEYPEMEIKSKG